jgi:hypothetical protein
MPPKREPRPGGNRTGLEKHVIDNHRTGDNAEIDHCTQPCHALLGDLRFRRDVERLHGLGPRPLYEMLVALGCDRMIRTELEERVRRYGTLDLLYCTRRMAVDLRRAPVADQSG